MYSLLSVQCYKYPMLSMLGKLHCSGVPYIAERHILCCNLQSINTHINICICVCEYIYIYIYLYIYIYIYIYICMYIYIYIYIYI